MWRPFVIIFCSPLDLHLDRDVDTIGRDRCPPSRTYEFGRGFVCYVVFGPLTYCLV